MDRFYRDRFYRSAIGLQYIFMSCVHAFLWCLQMLICLIFTRISAYRLACKFWRKGWMHYALHGRYGLNSVNVMKPILIDVDYSELESDVASDRETIQDAVFNYINYPCAHLITT